MSEASCDHDSQGVAGGAAGGWAAAATTPLDVVKTRLQLEGVASRTRYLSLNAVRARGCSRAADMALVRVPQWPAVSVQAICMASRIQKLPSSGAAHVRMHVSR